jgi:hypothetical protein
MSEVERGLLELQLAAAEKILAIRRQQLRRLSTAGKAAIAGEELDQAEIHVIGAQLEVDMLRLQLEEE